MGEKTTLAIFLAVLIVVASVVCYAGYSWVQDKTEVVVVTGKHIDPGSSGQNHYIVVAGKEPFECDRPWWKFLDSKYGDYNPDTVYGNIEIGKKYILHYYGWRWDSLWFFNIYWYPIVFYAEPVYSS